MKKLLLVFCILFVIKGFGQNSIYDYKVLSASGQEIDFNDFRGKIIMIVNTASGSERNTQFLQLDSLCRSYAEIGLVVVAFPSDDFLHEPKSNNDLQNLIAGFSPNFFLAAKSKVKGENLSAVYQWGTQKTLNGLLDSEIKGDFQKFIINRTGNIIGIYSGRISPVDALVLKTINAN